MHFCFSKHECLGSGVGIGSWRRFCFAIPVTLGSGAGAAVTRWSYPFHVYQGLKLNLTLGDCLTLIFLLFSPPHAIKNNIVKLQGGLFKCNFYFRGWTFRSNFFFNQREEKGKKYINSNYPLPTILKHLQDCRSLLNSILAIHGAATHCKIRSFVFADWIYWLLMCIKVLCTFEAISC